MLSNRSRTTICPAFTSRAGSLGVPLIYPICLHKTRGVSAYVSLSRPASPDCCSALILLSNYLLLIREKDTQLRVKEHKTPLSLEEFLPYAFRALSIFSFPFPFLPFPFFSSPGISRILIDPVYSLAQGWKMCWHQVEEKLSEGKLPKQRGGGKSNPSSICAHMIFISENLDLARFL